MQLLLTALALLSPAAILAKNVDYCYGSSGPPSSIDDMLSIAQIAKNRGDTEYYLLVSTSRHQELNGIRGVVMNDYVFDITHVKASNWDLRCGRSRCSAE